ncbi:mechanosensitive ion channel family protein [Flavobacterium sp.]
MSKFNDYSLFEFGKLQLNLSTIIGLIVAFVILTTVLKIIKFIINKSSKFDSAKKYSLYQLIKYIIVAVGIVAFFHILGFNISYLLVGSSALLVGLGFGLQNLFSDFISGIIILLDSSVKVSDIIEVNGIIGRVTEIKFRTTTVITRDDKYIIIPNTDLTKNNLVNWTHENVTSRFEISIGVDYKSDVNKVIELLLDVAKKNKFVLTNPVPVVRFVEFAESSLNFEILFWSDEIFRIENIKSDIRLGILKAFNENNINIPFPNRVLHFNQILAEEKNDK